MVKTLEIRISGIGGQGILLAGHILAEALTMEALTIAQSQSYEPTSRGGLSSSDLLASDGPIDYPLATALDYLIILDQVAVNASSHLLGSKSVVLVDESRIQDPINGTEKHFFLPLSETARKLDNIRSTNMVALGALIALGEMCPIQTLCEAAQAVTSPRLAASSIEAIQAGHRIALELIEQ